jgi:hypothetical protein
MARLDRKEFRHEKKKNLIKFTWKELSIRAIFMPLMEKLAILFVLCNLTNGMKVD